MVNIILIHQEDGVIVVHLVNIKVELVKLVVLLVQKDIINLDLDKDHALNVVVVNILVQLVLNLVVVVQLVNITNMELLHV
jgi:hypothetical protein